ncbi:hypothetical protein [Marinoscillum luteum]|uniref:Uncharacterized protein n=1 Tax=Marinoscillum luteum TaxID=861051 RepID=A0ABW7NFJ5_9BACT
MKSLKVIFILSATFIILDPSNAQKAANWTDLVNVEVSEDNLTLTGYVYNWGDGGAASVNILNENTDGWVETTANQTVTARMLGLSETNEDAHYLSIDFAIYLRQGGELRVYEKGVLMYTSASPYAVGDILKIARESGTITYKKNDVTFYTSTVLSTTALIVDVAFHDGSLNNLQISDSFSSPSTAKWAINGSTLYYENGIAIGRPDIIDDYLLTVEGKILSQEVKVTMDGWSDFVFDDNYKLLTLEEMEQYITENGHLPEIPSETEVLQSGIHLGEMNAKLLQKIEELTLHMIEMNKQIQQLKVENQTLLDQHIQRD